MDVAAAAVVGAVVVDTLGDHLPRRTLTRGAGKQVPSFPILPPLPPFLLSLPRPNTPHPGPSCTSLRHQTHRPITQDHPTRKSSPTPPRPAPLAPGPLISARCAAHYSVFLSRLALRPPTADVPFGWLLRSGHLPCLCHCFLQHQVSPLPGGNVGVLHFCVVALMSRHFLSERCIIVNASLPMRSSP